MKGDKHDITLKILTQASMELMRHAMTIAKRYTLKIVPRSSHVLLYIYRKLFEMIGFGTYYLK